MQRSRRPAKQPGPGDQPAHEAWAHDIERGTSDGAEEPARRTDERSLRPVRDEVRAGGPGHDFDFRTGLVEQGRGFERALPGANHHDPLAGEPTQIGVVKGMRCEWCRQSCELRRAPGEWADARGHHHAPRVKFLPIRDPHAEPLRVCDEGGDGAPIDIRYRLLLEPVPVAYEILDRHGLDVRKTMEGMVAVESQPTIGISEIGSACAGTQEHAFRHVPFPERHRLTEDPSFDVLGAEVRRGGQSVRPRPDDRDVTRRAAVPQGALLRVPESQAVKALRNPHAVRRRDGSGCSESARATELWLGSNGYASLPDGECKGDVARRYLLRPRLAATGRDHHELPPVDRVRRGRRVPWRRERGLPQ